MIPKERAPLNIVFPAPVHGASEDRSASRVSKLPTVRNSILRGLSPADLSYIYPLLEFIPLGERVVLQERHRKIEYVDFIEAGIVSLRTLDAGTTLETAIVGRHGIVGASAALGTERSSQRAVVMISGGTMRINRDDLKRAMSERPQIWERLLRYIESQIAHSAQIALCGICHGLEKRLACWLCLVCDALDNNVIPATHDYVSAGLGMRRASVTEALARFEDQGIVQRGRGVLHVRDRTKLQQKTCGCYGVIKSAYSLETPVPPSRPAAATANQCQHERTWY
ncbi:Crp/Fnr family transcriptional regulator [Bradyrhizobium sp. Pear77]|uniref:Crp/Fnr family transcriptional regulator n=1 Tax=Bradyrhizobium altum TaxID=1571202 RepID=UPI001E4EE6B1|nr:Crp/Fnr family transcriptional regulator [Bradyrhizobium altum]MCC8957356.1 Crp/Fnr family transcriptional regulator [Bradyrhizobium altum]